jgi:hypothetical protein
MFFTSLPPNLLLPNVQNRTSGLSWGQQTIWRAFEAVGTPIWLTGVKPVPDGMTVQDLADRLGFIMSRHQSLRTRLQLSGDGPGDGQSERTHHRATRGPFTTRGRPTSRSRP